MNERIISTDTVKPGRPEPVKAGPPPRPIQTADLRTAGAMTPADFVKRHAIPDEWAAFQRTVAARLAKEPRAVWEKCVKCGFVIERPYRISAELTEPGGTCIKCNWGRLADGGHMRDMSPAEVKAHLAAVKERNARELERDRRAAFYRRNDERQRAGLPPFKTIEEWAAAEARSRVRAAGGKR